MVIDVGVVKNHIKPKKKYLTLYNMRKDDLIEYIRTLEHNYNVAVSFNENQAKYIESLGFPGAVHGRWTRKPIGKYTGVDEVCCSICDCFIGVVTSDTGFREAIEGMNYCPNCGAKMDGDWNG